MARKPQSARRPAASRGAGRPLARGGRKPAPTSGRSVGVWVAVVALVVGLGAVGLSRLDSGAAQDAATVAYDGATNKLEFDLPTFDGGRLSTVALAGKPVVVNFYASWCTVCDAEMPDFEQVHQSLGDKVQIVGVNAQSRDADGPAQAMVARAGVTYPTARDRDDTLLRKFNLTGALPTTLFIDAQGIVVDVHNGGLTAAQLEASIDRAFGVS